MSSLPSNALQASRAALASALAENPPPPNEHEPDVAEDPEEINEVQEIDIQAQVEGIRTVFNDPTNFNVKVTTKLGAKRTVLTHSTRVQHPLYSAWTLWFDSPATKGRNLPQTPVSAQPPTPLPQTPVVAPGWMEDIKKVISFDSVEEFWGYVSHSPEKT
jgi:translation initiation factor 4E